MSSSLMMLMQAAVWKIVACVMCGGSVQVGEIELDAIALALELLAEAHAHRRDAAGRVQIVALVTAVAIPAA